MPPDPAAFTVGVGEGLYGTGKAAVTGVRSALMTNPTTTVRNVSYGIAGMTDAVIAAEDTPARIQFKRATDAITSASARDIGRAVGSVAGNGALAAVPGAALSKILALRHMGKARPRPTFDPPEIGWVRETVRSSKPWKLYNDTATGARAGHAPALTRKMSDGSTRPVKFDGIQADYVVDRKWKIVDAPHARAQLLRQSDVLAQHRLIGVWEVPTLAQKNKALKLLKKMNITNINIRIVAP